MKTEPTVKELLYANLKIANLYSWLDCFGHTCTKEEFDKCKSEIKELENILTPPKTNR